MFPDSIEANVESASVHVEQGNQQLHQAKNYQVNSAALGGSAISPRP